MALSPFRIPRLAALAGALALAALACLAPRPSAANCVPVAEAPGVPGGLMRAAFARPGPVGPRPRAGRIERAQARTGAPPPEGSVEITYLGHSSFAVRTPKGVSAITDYNGVEGGLLPPDIVTMNHAHESHYTDFIESGVKHVLRGWTTAETGYPRHDVRVGDLRVRNVATNIRGAGGGTEFAGNSIFIYEVGELCIAHLGHLHHQLTKDHLARIGAIDILFVAIDDGYTMPQADYARVIRDINPGVVIPMHFFGQHQVDKFLNLMAQQGYAGVEHPGRTIRLAKRALPRRRIIVLRGGGF
jgi:L-ascorbate metabolism protein UlaG (beta-lactamase superfamily)